MADGDHGRTVVALALGGVLHGQVLQLEVLVGFVVGEAVALAGVVLVPQGGDVAALELDAVPVVEVFELSGAIDHADIAGGTGSQNEQSLVFTDHGLLLTAGTVVL